MDRAEGIGGRVRKLRLLADMTGPELAEKAGVSRAYISMIETGKRAVDKRQTLDVLAAALGVSVNDLTGQPYLPVTSADLQISRVLPLVRSALTDPDDGRPVTARPLPELERQADLAMRARMHCDVPALGEHLPAVLAETRALWFGRGDREAGELLVKAAVTGSLALKAAGHVDIGIRLAELADQVARSHGDPICRAAATFAVAQCELTIGRRRNSARLAVDTANELDGLTRTSSNMPAMRLNAILAWMGALHLHAALATATLGGDAQGHLAEAATIAPRIVGDPWRMEIHPANVGVWRVAVALEEGSPDLAPQLARAVDVNALRTPQRRSRLRLDLGRAAFATGDYDAAVRQMLLADQAAPGDLRQRPTAVELVGHLVRRTGTGSEQLRDLAVRVGVHNS